MPWWNSHKDKADPSAQQRFGAEAFALTCLALELAKADDNFDAQEQVRLRNDLAHHFDLDESEVEALIKAAEVHQSQLVETYSLTRTLRETLDEEQRVVVIETLWRLAYADAHLDGQELAFMRTIPAALGIKNHVSEAAKRRALAALDTPSGLS